MALIPASNIPDDVVLRKAVTEAVAKAERQWHDTYVDGQSTYRSKCEIVADTVIPLVKRATAEAQLAYWGGRRWPAWLCKWWRDNRVELIGEKI